MTQPTHADTHILAYIQTHMHEKTLHKLYHMLPGQSTLASTLHFFTPFTTNACQGWSLITPISHKSKPSLAVRLPPAAPERQGLAVLHKALAPTWEQLLEMRERQDYISRDGNLPF